MPMTRRTFLQSSAAAAALATMPVAMADPLGLPIGFQSYVIRKSVATDFEGTMKRLHAAGFQAVELCSPYGYSDFASLQKYSPKELSALLRDWGLPCISSHWSSRELFNDKDKSIAYAREFGMTQMAIAALGPFKGKGDETIDDIRRYVDPFNAFAVKAHAAGITPMLHNEGFVSKTIQGRKVYDVMIEELDPVVKFQFQVSTMQDGFDPIYYFGKYPGRYLSMHCQDWVRDPVTESGFRQVPIGKGLVDWKSVFAAAGRAGVKNYFVELEEDPALMPPSIPYLKSLHV